MALHHELPIYRSAFELLTVAAIITRNIPRDFKRYFSEKVITECSEMTLLIFRANKAHDKVPHIDELLEHLDVTTLLFRLFVEKRWISKGQYAIAINLTSDIGKQAGGWKKSSTTAPDLFTPRSD